MAERRSGRSTFKRQLDMLDGRNIFVDTEWADWLRDKRNKIQNVSLTIMEHKKYFLNKRPDRAKTFSEKRMPKEILIKKSNKYFTYLLRLSPEEWSIEREIVENGEDNNFVVERILNASGDCRYVATIFPDKDNSYIYRRENWVAKGQWVVTQKRLFNRKAGFYTEAELLNSTETWFKIFK